MFVHGAWHGAWCWERLLPILAGKGHEAVAIDLPGSGRDQTPPEEVSLDRCVAQVAAAVDRLGDNVWLVGHSLGGATITAAAEQAAGRIAGLIYIAAMLPRSGEVCSDAVGDGTAVIIDKLYFTPDGMIAVREDAIADLFYGECEESDAAWATGKVQPQPGTIAMTRPTLSDERYGRIPRYYVECLRDRAILPHAQMAMYQRAGVDRVFTMDTDHSPFLSRPAELAEIMEEIVGGAPGGRL